MMRFFFIEIELFKEKGGGLLIVSPIHYFYNIHDREINFSLLESKIDVFCVIKITEIYENFEHLVRRFH